MLDPEALLRPEAFHPLLAHAQGATVGILGLGISGLAAARVWAQRGAKLHILDDGPAGIPDDVAPAVLAQQGTDAYPDGLAALFVSPGFSLKHPVVTAAAGQGIPVFGELSMLGTRPGRTIAITGTNGKSTTTALTVHLLQALGEDAVMGGNIGVPMLALRTPTAESIDVFELSSYQLELNASFRPDVAVMLNLTPDHLARHGTLAAYAEAKSRLVRYQGQADLALLPAPPDPLASLGSSAATETWDRDPGVPLDHPRLFGDHNRANARAAMAAVRGLLPAVDAEALRAAYLSFPGLAHRLEWVADVGGVTVINDSKATNDDAAAVGVRAVKGPVVLLLGGRDKGDGYDAVLAAAAGKVKRVVAFGEAAPLIEAACAGRVSVVSVADLATAVSRGLADAAPGDTLLLSPACSSFDAFPNFAQRGDAFKAKVGERGRG